MSGSGRPAPTVEAVDARVGIIAATWHAEIMAGLIAGATRTCEAAEASWELHSVPGSFELPLGCQRAAATGRFDALVALGVVVRGGTPHFEHVCAAATEGLTRVGLDTGLPIGFGLLTCDTEGQALDRAGLATSSMDKGAEAAHAALTMIGVLRALG